MILPKWKKLWTVSDRLPGCPRYELLKVTSRNDCARLNGPGLPMFVPFGRVACEVVTEALIDELESKDKS